MILSKSVLMFMENILFIKVLEDSYIYQFLKDFWEVESEEWNWTVVCMGSPALNNFERRQSDTKI